MNVVRSRSAWLALCLALALAGVAGISGGCGKAKEEAATPAPAAEAAPAETETASTGGDESTTESLTAQQFNVAETLGASDQAVKNKDWSGATDNLLKLQLSGSIKSVDDSWKYNQRMTALQNQLLQAAESGDPKAKAAIELLKKSRRVP